jgi:hypothetical protein
MTYHLSDRVFHSPVSTAQVRQAEAPVLARGGASASTNVHSLAALWARKYVTAVTTQDEPDQSANNKSLSQLTSSQGRAETAQRLLQNLTLASAQAWSKTETLLAGEARRHGIHSDLINPWQIAGDCHGLFQKCLTAYADRLTPHRLSVLVGAEIGSIRQKYTADDPRAIGFVSMQFHYTGMMLLEQLSSLEKSLLTPYLKVMDDHLYMPLRDAYEAAANHPLESPVLLAVQQFLPISSKIAHATCNHVRRLFPAYASYSGSLNSPAVITASLRDVEMFQVYLCLCALENTIRSVQQELFPLCVMLYPRLNVRWKLVQEMLQTIGWEMHDRLAPDHVAVFLPYLRALTDMFAIDLFQSL